MPAAPHDVNNGCKGCQDILKETKSVMSTHVQVAIYMALFYKRHPFGVVYVGLVGLCRTAAEAHALYMLLTHPDMTAGEAFSSFICSHLMTPTINAALAVLQVATQLHAHS